MTQHITYVLNPILPYEFLSCEIAYTTMFLDASKSRHHRYVSSSTLPGSVEKAYPDGWNWSR